MPVSCVSRNDRPLGVSRANRLMKVLFIGRVTPFTEPCGAVAYTIDLLRHVAEAGHHVRVLDLACADGWALGVLRRFADADPAPARPVAVAPRKPPAAPPPPPPGAARKAEAPTSSPSTEVDGTPVDEDDRTVVATPGALERTARTARTPWGNLANDMP